MRFIFSLLSAVLIALSSPISAQIFPTFDNIYVNDHAEILSPELEATLTQEIQALREETPLAQWVEAGLRRVKPAGHLTMIHLADRLPEILCALIGKAGIMVRPLTPRMGREAGRVLVLAKKGGRAPFRLLAPLVLHEGASHQGDRDDFSPEARAVLRDGQALPWS